MSDKAILSEFSLGFPWNTFDPFLFCVHHDDAYPEGNDDMGPDPALLLGRNIGSDFEGIDGWRMYHGDVVPGFPRHPHRGFETVSIARRGYMDHSDSLGAKARFGDGDVQWMTAGRGIVHAEMFPLVKRDGPNPGELFQIWINLPGADKMVEPHFSMLWSEGIPRLALKDEASRLTELVVVAGQIAGSDAPPAPPIHSWARKPEAEVVICTIKMEAGATWTIPAASPELNRTLYFFRGGAVHVAGRSIDRYCGLRLGSDVKVELRAGEAEAEFLLLQGRPIGEPVAHYGPFVMNTAAEIQQAILDFRSTGYGGWPWPEDGPVHPREEGRFALHASGDTERPDSQE